MKRILQFEANARFFDLFGAAFVKSFYAHNKGWDLYVSDLGLTAEQCELLSRYGTVKKYPVDPCRRWINLTARVYTLADIVRPDTIVHRLDLDGVVTRSHEPVIKEFTDGGYGVMGMELPYSITERTRNITKVSQLLEEPIESTAIQQHSLSASLLTFRGTPEVMRSFEWLRENWDEFFIYCKEEEPAISCALYKFGVSCKRIGWEYYNPTCMVPDISAYAVPGDAPYSVHSAGPAYGIHFAVGKYYLLNSSVWLNNDTFRAWCDALLAPYANLPWPDPEKVRDHS